jgi:hypothetical protein
MIPVTVVVRDSLWYKYHERADRCFHFQRDKRSPGPLHRHFPPHYYFQDRDCHCECDCDPTATLREGEALYRSSSRTIPVPVFYLGGEIPRCNSYVAGAEAVA